MKLCWNCRHFCFINSSPGYSEWTPGENFELSCDKKHWEFNPFETTQNEFKIMISHAEKCMDYTPIEDKK